MTRTLRIALFTVSLTALVACGDDSAPACTAGMSVACVGPGGCAGGQVCNADGSGFGDCVCGAPDSGPSDAGGDDTGTVDTGTADTGSDDAGPEDAGFDVGPPAEFNCNPLTGVPCEGGTPRCTATFVDGVTTFDCAAEGTAALGDMCTEAGTEVDDCRSNALCVGETCVEICNALDASPSCDTGDCSSLTITTEEVPVGICLG